MPASLFNEIDRSRELMETHMKAAELSAYNHNIHNLSMLLNENDCLTNAYDGEPRNKKSQNTTECVPVPSSEHVAEIVGRQGCKIKALRAKTNTYIKTPVRGEEPVFVVTGRKEDVCSAKREILSAAEHFSQIRAQRKNNLNGALMPGPNSNIPGQTTISVRVPYRVVGLVVGPKGATIKRIQQQTSTYIVTPSREKEPIFEVTGLPDNVETARKEIEAHIAMRTGGSMDSADEDFNSNLDSYTNNLNAINAPFFKSDLSNSYSYPFARDSNNVLDLPNVDNIFSFSSSNRNAKQNDVFNSGFGFTNAFSNVYDLDDGFCSPTFEVAPGGPPRCSPSWPDCGTSTLTDSGISLFGGSTSIGGSSGGLSELSQRSSLSAFQELTISDHPPARRIHSDPVSVPEVGDILANIGNLGNLGSGLSMSSFSPLASSTAPGSLSSGYSAAVTKCTSSSSSPIENLAPGKKPKRDCIICYESAVVAALVPCGHNSFCLECASRICNKSDKECPICKQPATQAIRIYN